MQLGALKRNWERLGRRDPFWAVLTDPAKRGGGWDREEFYRGGAEEIAAALARAEQLGVRRSRRRALDFGCGVGRITQALADHFERCDGVDISTSMLEAARLNNRHPDRCTYHLNDKPDLGLFDAATLQLRAIRRWCCSTWSRRYSERYIRELLRLLAPDGLLVFQLPSHRAARRTSADAARTEIAGRLPRRAFSARLSIDAPALSLRAAQEVALEGHGGKLFAATSGRRYPTPGAAIKSTSRTAGSMTTATCYSATMRAVRCPMTCRRARARN